MSDLRSVISLDHGSEVIGWAGGRRTARVGGSAGVKGRRGTDAETEHLLAAEANRNSLSGRKVGVRKMKALGS